MDFYEYFTDEYKSEISMFTHELTFTWKFSVYAKANAYKIKAVMTKPILK